jgi:hypothetical protein
MLRKGEHLLGHVAVNVLDAGPHGEGAPDFVSPNSTAENDAGFKDGFPRQPAGNTSLATVPPMPISMSSG